MNERSLFEIESLTVELLTPVGWVRRVNEVSLNIAAGESVGLAGESGSGKTMLSLAQEIKGLRIFRRPFVN